MTKHILIAVDTSEESETTLQKGVELAALHGAKVTVLHVMELPVPMVGEMALVDTYFNHEEYAKVAKETLIDLIGRVSLSEGDLRIVTGLPAKAVVSYAEDNNVDLIVTGSHGKSGLKLLLGSVTTAILHKAKCDVYVYRIS